MSADSAKRATTLTATYIQDLAPHAMRLIEALGIAPWMIFAPIAKDWVAYNAEDNRGELLPARL